MPIQEFILEGGERQEWVRAARTCLEYTFACNAFSLSAEAYSAESSAIDEFENNICPTSIKLGSRDGGCREAIAVRASDGRPRVGAQVQV